MPSKLEISAWRFWSPESEDPGGWLNHWRGGGVRQDADPDAGRVPPMQRRRMSRLSKMALSAALDVAADAAIDYSVFCSQHGEIVRTRAILASISEGAEISPAAFAQSVHNTSSGLFTIITESNAPSTSIASGGNSFACGWLDAEAYIAANPQAAVLLVDFDEVIPAEYRNYSAQVDCDHVLALVLRAAGENGVTLGRTAPGDEDRLPQGPQFLAWLQTDAASLALTTDGQGWRWER